MAAREDYAGRKFEVDYRNVKADKQALDEMLKYSKGKRDVPVIVEDGNVIIGFGGS